MELDLQSLFTDEKEKLMFLIYKEIQSGSVTKSNMTNGLIYGEIFANFPISEEALSHI
jgi:hypothetical protein